MFAYHSVVYKLLRPPDSGGKPGQISTINSHKVDFFWESFESRVSDLGKSTGWHPGRFVQEPGKKEITKRAELAAKESSRERIWLAADRLKFKSGVKRESNFRKSGNEVDYTACSLLVI